MTEERKKKYDQLASEALRKTWELFPKLDPGTAPFRTLEGMEAISALAEMYLEYGAAGLKKSGAWFGVVANVQPAAFPDDLPEPTIGRVKELVATAQRRVALINEKLQPVEGVSRTETIISLGESIKKQVPIH